MGFMKYVKKYILSQKNEKYFRTLIYIQNCVCGGGDQNFMPECTDIKPLNKTRASSYLYFNPGQSSCTD